MSLFDHWHRLLRWVVLCYLSIQSCACGYTFANSGHLPQGIDSVCIPAFVDHTAEGDTGAVVAASVRSSLRALNTKFVAPLHQCHDAILVGEVRNIAQSTVPMGRDGRVVAGLYRLEVVAVARIENGSGRVLVDLGRFVESGEYPVEDGIGASEEARRRALQRVARQLGERIADVVVNRF